MKNHSQFKEGPNTYDGFDFELKRKKIKNYIIRLDAKKRIVVSVPWRFSHEFLKTFLDKNLPKIGNHQKNLEEKKPINLEEKWFYLFGEKVYYEIDEENKKIFIENKKISWATKSIEEVIENYKKKELKVYLLITQLQYQKLINIESHIVRVRNKARAWASNHVNDKVIYYSTNLASFSKELINYVIVHELAHNKFHNHSKDFWNFVSKYEPEYKLKRHKLNKSIYQ